MQKQRPRVLTAKEARELLAGEAAPEKARDMSRFFKTGPGEYAEGDVFWGIGAPRMRAVAAAAVALPLPEVERLLEDPVHEVRACALVIMTLPTVIRTTQESLRTVPRSYREGALGLGAGRWRTIRTVVLPSSVDGIVTGCILAVGRVVGESAVLMYTAGLSTAMQDFSTIQGLLRASGATLTVALYVYAKERADFAIAFTIATLLLILTGLINLAAHLAGRLLRRG